MAGMKGRHHSEETKLRIRLTMMGQSYPLSETAKRHKARYKRFRLQALAIVGRGIIACVSCGCDDPRLLEINHKNGGGSKESGGRTNKQAVFLTKIRNGERSIEDLDLRCRVCNGLSYVESKFGKLPFKIVWLKQEELTKSITVAS